MPEKQHHVNAVSITGLVALVAVIEPEIVTPLKLISQVTLVIAIALVINGKQKHLEYKEISGYRLMILAYLQSISLLGVSLFQSVMRVVPQSWLELVATSKIVSTTLLSLS